MFRRGDKHVIHLAFMLNAACMQQRGSTLRRDGARKRPMTIGECSRLGRAARRATGADQGIGSSGCLPLCSCMSTAVSIAAVPA
jgi:hypothetical protein